MFVVTKIDKSKTEYFPQQDWQELDKSNEDYRDGFICIENRNNGESHYFPCEFYTVRHVFE